MVVREKGERSGGQLPCPADWWRRVGAAALGGGRRHQL